MGDGTWKNAHYFAVAAFYPNEGYGGASSFPSLEPALIHAEKMRRLGYKDVHVKEITVKVIRDDAEVEES